MSAFSSFSLALSFPAVAQTLLGASWRGLSVQVQVIENEARLTELGQLELVDDPVYPLGVEMNVTFDDADCLVDAAEWQSLGQFPERFWKKESLSSSSKVKPNRCLVTLVVAGCTRLCIRSDSGSGFPDSRKDA